MKGSLFVLHHPPTPHCILVGSRVHVSTGNTGEKSLCSLPLPFLPILGRRFIFWWYHSYLITVILVLSLGALEQNKSRALSLALLLHGSAAHWDRNLLV